MGVRIWEPCDDPNGVGCTLFEDPETHHLAETRWYPSSLRVFDGSLVGLLRLCQLTFTDDPEQDGGWRDT